MKKSVVLVVGASGLVGGALLRALRERDMEVIGTHRSYSTADTVFLDLSDRAAAAALLRELRPAIVMFPAAHTNVEACEANPQDSRVSNVDDTIAFIQSCENIPFVYYSSEYVFDGRNGPYCEADTTCPISAYGHQKKDVESYLSRRARALVVRTVHVFGPERQRKNFVYGLMRVLRDKRVFPVPVDQISTPTYVRQLADASVKLINEGLEGVVHLAGRDRMSRYDFAVRAAKTFGLDHNLIEPVKTESLQQCARRPLSAGLFSNRVDFAALGMTGVDEALYRAKSEM